MNLGELIKALQTIQILGNSLSIAKTNDGKNLAEEHVINLRGGTAMGKELLLVMGDASKESMSLENKNDGYHELLHDDNTTRVLENPMQMRVNTVVNATRVDSRVLENNQRKFSNPS